MLKAMLSLKQLPDDIQGLYAFFLHQIENGPGRKDVPVRDPLTGKIGLVEAWTHLYYPILALLTVAQESLTVDQVHAMANTLAERPQVVQAIDWLEQFLDRVGGTIRLFHATLAEFLTAASTKEDARTASLYVDQDQEHLRIARHFLEVWGGWDAGLPGLLDPANRDRDGRYGLIHVVDHLAFGGDWSEIERLVASFIAATGGSSRQPWADAWFAAPGHYGSYLKDLERFWERAEKAGDVGTAVSAALIASTIRTQGARFSPRLLVGLVTVGTTAGRWSQSAALEYAHLYVDPTAKAEVVSRLLGSGIHPDWELVIPFGSSVGDPSACRQLFAAVGEAVPASHVPAVLRAIRESLSEGDRDGPLETLIDRTSELGHEVWSSIRDEVRRLPVARRGPLLARLAHQSTWPDRSVTFEEALRAIGELHEADRIAAIARVTAILPEELLEEAETLARTAGGIEMTARTRLALCQRRPEGCRDAVARRILEEVTGAPPFDVKCRLLLEVREFLPVHLQEEADRALTTALAESPEEEGQLVFVCLAIRQVDARFIPSLLAAGMGQQSRLIYIPMLLGNSFPDWAIIRSWPMWPLGMYSMFLIRVMTVRRRGASSSWLPTSRTNY